MRVGMVPDRVPLCPDSLDDVRKPLGMESEHEKRGVYALVRQDVENSWRPFRMGSVIESQTHRLRGTWAFRHEHRSRQRRRQSPSGHLPEDIGRAFRMFGGIHGYGEATIRHGPRSTIFRASRLFPCAGFEYGFRAMVIAHVVASFQVGGQEAMVLELATRQRVKGHRVIAVTLEKSPPGPLQEAFTLAGIETLQISRLGPRFDFTLPIRLALALRRRAVEVVHVHNHSPYVYGTVAGSLLRCTVIATRHGSNERYGSPLWLRRQLSRWVDSYVAVSTEIAENARSHGLATEPKLTVIDNGIDLEKYTPRPEWRREVRAEFGVSDTARVIGIVGRLVEVKNVGLLLRSCLPHLGAETQLFIVGDGPERNALESAATQHPNGGFARFLGQRKDVARLLNGIDLFALSSKIEGHPLAVIEAMATGLPVLAPKVGGIPDMVEDGRTGFLAGLVGSAYAERLTDALSQSASWPAMGQAGRAVAAERFSSETMAERYLALYEQARRHRHAS